MRKSEKDLHYEKKKLDKRVKKDNNWVRGAYIASAVLFILSFFIQL